MEIENTLKKMGIVLEKLAQKIDELDKRVSKIEEKLENKDSTEKKFSSEDLKPAQHQPQTIQENRSSSSSLGGFGSSFLGSLTGSMAGMGLYHLLFDHSVTPENLGENLGMNENEINNVDLDNIDNKLNEIDSKLDEIDEKFDDNLEDNDIMDNDYYDNSEEKNEENDIDNYNGYDDFNDFDDDDI